MKAAIYCRLSEEDKNKKSLTDDSESIQNQKSMLTGYCRAQGWEVYRIYSDDDYTGADRKRPAFNCLLADAETHKFDIILCKTQSRFTRELELVEKYIHGLFPVWGIRFVSLADNADTDNKGNKKSRQINGLVNEWYLEDMSENIKSVLTDKRRNGLHIGSFALYGYKKDPERKGHLIIDEEAASVVREIFILFSRGYGKTAIARILNDRGIPNPTEYKRLHGLHYQQPKSSNSTLWKYFSISSMLQNEIYIGNMVQGKYGSVSYKTKQNKPRPKEEWYRVEGTHEPIIEHELWERVQSLLKQNSKPFSTGKIGIFAKKARCAGCGYTMRSSKSHGLYYLKCPNRHVSENACTGSFISVDRLEQAVIKELNRLTDSCLDMDMLKKQIDFTEHIRKQQNTIQNELTLYQTKIEEYTKAVQELYLDKVKGVVSEEDYLSFSKSFSAEKKRLEQRAEQVKAELRTLQEHLHKEGHMQKHLEQYLYPDHLTREIVEKLIDHISVNRRIPGTNEIPVEIYWNF